MKRVKVVILGVMIGLLLTTSTSAQKTKYQSLFIYNFAKYIKWPTDFNSGKFVIGILGECEISRDIENMVNVKKEIQGLKMEVKMINSIDEMVSCNLLFVSNDFCDRFSDIQKAIDGTPTLIVTDKEGMAKKGAAINFVEQNGKIRFELNQSDAENLGLKISNSLASLAILV